MVDRHLIEFSSFFIPLEQGLKRDDSNTINTPVNRSFFIPLEQGLKQARDRL